MSKTQTATNSPAALVAIAKAARQAGDRDLERAARRQLQERHGIRITFDRHKEAPPCQR